MKLSIITANGDARDGALFIALSRLCPGLRIIAPVGTSPSTWPNDVQIESVRTTGSNWTQQWMRGLEGLIEAHDPDLIHVHNEPWAVSSQRLVRGNRPVVIHGAENILATAPLIYRIRRVGIEGGRSRRPPATLIGESPGYARRKMRACSPSRLEP